MARTGWSSPLATALCAATLLTVGVGAQPPAAPPQGAGQGPGAGRGGGGGRGGAAGGVIFGAADADKDGSVTRAELKGTFDKWFSAWDGGTGALTQDQLAVGLNGIFPAAPAGGGRGAQNQTPKPEDVAAMMAALPDKAPATPARPRKVLVLAKSQGFVHSSIPLAAKTVEAMGDKTKAWATTITYDSADITTDNLKQYDAVFLASTTGTFLDDPADAAATAARRKALLDFVRGGKGLAGIHAASDSYHGNPNPPAPAAAGRGGQGGGLATQFIAAGDTNADQKLSKDEFSGLADMLYDKVDTEKAGKVAQAEFAPRFVAALPAGAGRGAGPAGPAGPQVNEALWPEFNTMIGGFFKFHWN
ncbi:MAG: ThuA domain-containing protein, partial [Vicinamibacterales bacterium]